jgi:hypothetical protein
VLGLTISAVLAFVAGILSYGLFVPEDLRVFILLAAAGSMAGYALGDLTAKNTKNPIPRAICIALTLLVCGFALIKYLIGIQQGNANTADVVWLGVRLTTGFLSLTFLMAVSGVSISK